MFLVRPVNVALSCHVAPFMLYSQPSTSVSLIIFAVAVSSVGAAGAVLSALFTVTVKLPVISSWFGALALK